MAAPRRPSRVRTNRRLDELRAALQAHGLRSTAPRMAVLQFLLEQGTPTSHRELYEALRGQGFDRVTLYRNLSTLTEAGIVTRSDLGDHVWRFDLARGGDAHATQHPHFVCSDCGRIICLPDVAVRFAPTSKTPKALAIGDIAIQVVALCDACIAPREPHPQRSAAQS